MKGYIMQLQPFSVNDGDGIRTTVFMPGCPLRCKWCSNPEGFDTAAKIGWYKRKCVGCGACAKACPQGIGINLNFEREKCIACGKCAEVCPAEARVSMVRLMDADDILAEIQKHRLFYSYSGGGVTFSGGEATSQPEFLDYLSRELYDMGYSMDIETSGMFDWDRLEPSLARMDLIFMDLKIFDSSRHKEYTGVTNERILQNIANLAKLKTTAPVLTGDGKSAPEIVIRIPVIGGVNDDDGNIRDSAAYVHKHVPDAKMELLPYHRYGMIKYEALGIPYDHPEFSTPSKARMEELRQIVREEGVEIADFR